MEVYFKVDEGDFRVVAPVKLGLHYCYSDICLDYRTRYFSPAVGQQSSASSTLRLQLPGLLPQRFEELEEPFFVAATISLVLLLLSALIGCLNISLFVHCSLTETSSRTFLDVYDKCRFLLTSSTLLTSAAVAGYIFLTANLLNGGRYLDGLWTVLVASVIGLLSSVFFYSLEEKEGFRYSPIAEEDSRIAADVV